MLSQESTARRKSPDSKSGSRGCQEHTFWRLHPFRSRWLQVRQSAAKLSAREWGVYMKRPVAVESASASIDQKIMELGDWRGKTLANVRDVVHHADPEIVEEWKWAKATSPGVPVWSRGGIVCTGETYKSAVKLT